MSPLVNYSSYILSFGYYSITMLEFSPLGYSGYVYGTSIFTVLEKWNLRIQVGVWMSVTRELFSGLFVTTGHFSCLWSYQLPGRLLQLGKGLSSYLWKSEAVFLDSWLLWGDSQSCLKFYVTRRNFIRLHLCHCNNPKSLQTPGRQG